ncbi:sodium/hydrogen exchanger 3-like [Tigriopus californicus]|nr:sodium/hydrogen exchanger 3-like [Tigriopus californicus]
MGLFSIHGSSKAQGLGLLVCLLLLAIQIGHIEASSSLVGSSQSKAALIPSLKDQKLQVFQSERNEEEKIEYEVFHVEFDRVKLPFVISLWILVSTMTKIAFHMVPKLDTHIPESCMLIVVGIVVGIVLFYVGDTVPVFMSPDTFFLYLLPPIILEAGYLMPNRLFFDHLGTILLMAVIGTIFNMLTIGGSIYGLGLTGIYGDNPPGILETFLFASLIVAVDPVAVLATFKEIKVDDILNIVVFGESLLNDAVTVVLYHMFEAYVDIGEENIETTDVFKGVASFIVVAGGGTLIGIIYGFLTAFVTRFSRFSHILEPLVVVAAGYMSYLTAEIFHMSGILALTFCGITMKNYVERNINDESSTVLHGVIEMLANSAETIIFVFLGVAAVTADHEWNWIFVVTTIVLCTIFRILGVLLLAALANRFRLHKLKPVDQFVMMYGGLRGAVAFALVLLIDKKKVPSAPLFVTTTLAVIYWTVFAQGITFKPLVKFLKVKSSTAKAPTMNERMAGRMMDFVVWGIEGVWGERSTIRFRESYRDWDRKYIMPIMHSDKQLKDPKIFETFSRLARLEALEGKGFGYGHHRHAYPKDESSDDSAGEDDNNVQFTVEPQLNQSEMLQKLDDEMMIPGERPRRDSFVHTFDNQLTLDKNSKWIASEAKRRLSEASALSLGKRSSMGQLRQRNSRGSISDAKPKEHREVTRTTSDMLRKLDEEMMSPGDRPRSGSLVKNAYDSRLTMENNSKNIVGEVKRRLSEASLKAQARRGSLASGTFDIQESILEDDSNPNENGSQVNRGFNEEE